jgi:hypothetical protein
LATSNEIQPPVPAVANLRETRKHMAEAKKRHPAVSKPPATKGPAEAADTVERKAPTQSKADRRNTGNLLATRSPGRCKTGQSARNRR